MALTKIWAFVREWDASTVRVRCPFCLRTHSHGLGTLDFARDTPLEALHKRRRAPHCGHLSDDYLLCFPFEHAARNRTYSWRIDKEQQKYVTIGLPADTEDENYFVKEVGTSEQEGCDSTAENSDSNDSDYDLTDKLANELQSKATLEENDFADFYAQDMANNKTRKIWFDSHCLLNEESCVERMLQQYLEDRLFNGRDEYGNDIMTLVAMEGHVCIMQLLHNAGAGVSNVNARGRTPLMEAALWGRDGAVKFLLGKGAEPHLTDHKSRKALDLAHDTEQNRRERAARSRMYQDSEELRNARVRIMARLEALTTANLVESGEFQDLNTLSIGRFQQAGFSLSWYDNATSYGLDYSTRTVGRLIYSSHLPATNSMSGSNRHRPHPHSLDNGLWTEQVRELCNAVGFTLPAHDKDRQFSGSFYACHAEKQLIAHHIDQHFFWGQELKDPDLKKLRRMKPTGSPPRATIAVNRKVCPNCEAFITHVQERFDIEIEVLHR